MLIKTIFSGFGGQGVLMMGYLLAMAGMYEEKNVTCYLLMELRLGEGLRIAQLSSQTKKLLHQSLQNLILQY